MGITNIKYVLQFNTVKTGVVYRVNFIDKINTYDDIKYPIYIKGSASPVSKSYLNSGETPYQPIIGSQLDIEVLAESVFDKTDFERATERQWKVELYKDGNLDWQGWILPDEITEEYTDAVAYYPMLASDALGSLKGIPLQKVINGVASIIPFYELVPYTDILYYCLFQLGYDYGNTNLICSLEVIQNAVYLGRLNWKNVKLWSDQFFDDSGEPNDCYSVLETLMLNFGLQIFQENGSFIICHANDRFYSQSITSQPDLIQSSNSFDQQFTTQSQGILPTLKEIGFNKESKPVNPKQSISYDKASGQIKADISFNTQALLYPNPSFEIAAVQDQLPIGWNKSPNIQAYSNYDPDDAYDGDWDFVITGNGNDVISFAELGPIVIDQSGKGLGFSMNWKAPFIGSNLSVLPLVAIFFFPTSGKNYNYDFVGGTWYEINAETYNGGGIWFTQQIIDFFAWNQGTFTSIPFPDSGTGNLYIRLYTGGVLEGSNSFPDNVPSTITYKIDSLELTVVDANDSYSKKVGETHIINNNTKYAYAETQEIDLTLYSFYINKRYTGNVLYGDDYLSAIGDNYIWGFKLSEPTISEGKRLPECIIRQYAKMYQRPMMKWSGDVYTDDFSFFSVVKLTGYEARTFIPVSAKHDLRQSILSLVIREISDIDYTYTYKYKAKFEKSARKVVNS